MIEENCKYNEDESLVIEKESDGGLCFEICNYNPLPSKISLTREQVLRIEEYLTNQN